MSGQQIWIMHNVADERARQDVKWGVRDHPPEVWLAILTEEVGELAHAIVGYGLADLPRIDRMRREAIQVAAVAVAFVECLDAKERPRD